MSCDLEASRNNYSNIGGCLMGACVGVVVEVVIVASGSGLRIVAFVSAAWHGIL